MEIHSLASGSSGNAYVVRTNGQAILLDAGMSGKKIWSGLVDIGVDPQHLQAVLVTHEHNDHIAGAGIISRRIGIPLYMTQGTWQGGYKKLGKLKENFVNIISPGCNFTLAEWNITPIASFHDAREPVNYIFDTGTQRIAVLTDTGCISRAMLAELADCNAMVVESNHDVDMLHRGPYPLVLKRRVASRQGHLSNMQAGKLATWLATQGRLKRLHLGHLSAVNNSPDIAVKTVLDYLAKAGLANEEISRSLLALPRQGIGPVLRGKQ